MPCLGPYLSVSDQKESPFQYRIRCDVSGDDGRPASLSGRIIATSFDAVALTISICGGRSYPGHHVLMIGRV